MYKLNTEKSNLSNEELERYARQMLLKPIGLQGQERLKNTKVLVIGAGGIGSSVIMYLAGLGVGKMGIIDDDIVQNSNLH